MSESVKYPWYRVHLATCFAAVVAAVGLTWPQLIWLGDGGFAHLAFNGWPLRFGVMHYENGWNHPEPIDAFVVNMLVSASLVVGVVAFVETAIRHFNFQFSLRSMFCLATVVALCLGKHFANVAIGDITVGLFGANLSLLFIHVPLIPSLVVYAASFCSLFVAVSIVLRLIGRFTKRGNA